MQQTLQKTDNRVAVTKDGMVALKQLFNLFQVSGRQIHFQKIMIAKQMYPLTKAQGWHVNEGL